jgi:DNA repair exonuclease SbcCD ATPase subunit
MYIENIKITNFKSIYGTQEFDFTNLDGLIKLSGPIGSGKTTLAEAILWGLFGTVKGQNNGHLISWNEKSCTVELNIISKNKKIHIIRNSTDPLFIEVNGKVLSASSKRNTQAILEEELFDVPKLAITKMCIISFNAFNSLADMNPAETKIFLDEIFGFKLFSDYNDEIVLERKTQQNEATKLAAIYSETLNQIERLKAKKREQEKEIESSVDLNEQKQKRDSLVEEGKKLKQQYLDVDNEYTRKENEINNQKLEVYTKKMEYATLGKQEKNKYNSFKSGKCPTCGHDIDATVIDGYKDKMFEYADLYKLKESEEQEIDRQIQLLKNKHAEELNKLRAEMNNIKAEITNIDTEIVKYNNAVKLIAENYDSLIKEAENKSVELKAAIDKTDIEIGEWNDMNELFTKTLRYNLLDTLIPHINKSIQYYINKLDQSFKITFDQEFKSHIFVDSFEKEIAYNNLSTGQRKSLDLAIIFGILQNIIASVNFNVILLDELFSNMDADTRNIMLTLLKEAMGEEKSIFVINHAEMNDDYFKHKIRVSLHHKKIHTKKHGETVVKASKYEKIF